MEVTVSSTDATLNDGRGDGTIADSEYEKLNAKIDASAKDDRNAMFGLLILLFVLYMGVMIGGINLDRQVDDLSKKMDEVSLSYEPLLNLLDGGPHCYDTGAEARAAQLRIFIAIDNSQLENRVDDKIDNLNKPYSMVPEMPYTPPRPEVSKTARNMQGKMCFNVSWPQDKKPRWAGGY